jgi:HSP20 family protein
MPGKYEAQPAGMTYLFFNRFFVSLRKEGNEMLTQQLPAVRTSFGRSLTEPFRDMDRLFDQLFKPFNGSTGWAAPMAVWEDESQVYVEAEVPGVSQDAIDVTVHNGQLHISCERRAPEGRQFAYNERQYGRFERRLSLPDTVDTDSIKAEMRDGILSVTLAKTPQAQPRKIAIQSSQSD